MAGEQFSANTSHGPWDSPSHSRESVDLASAASGSTAYPSISIGHTSWNSVTIQPDNFADPDPVGSQAPLRPDQAMAGFDPYPHASVDPARFGLPHETYWPDGNHRVWYAATGRGESDCGSPNSSNDSTGSMIVSAGTPPLVASPPVCHQADVVIREKAKAEKTRRDEARADRKNRGKTDENGSKQKKRLSVHKREPNAIPPDLVFLRDGGWGGHGHTYYDPNHFPGSLSHPFASPYPLYLNDADVYDHGGQANQPDQHDAGASVPNDDLNHNLYDDEIEIVD